jgi:hypothetical protein
MKARKFFSVLAMALSLTAWENSADVFAQEREGSGDEVLIVGSINSALGVDVYKLQCGAGSVCASADVRDIPPVFGTHFDVTIVGLSPVSIAGRASARTAPIGGLSAPATLCRTGSGAMTSYVVIDKSNDTPGVDNYDSLMLCRNAAGAVTPHAVVGTQNQ